MGAAEVKKNIQKQLNNICAQISLLEIRMQIRQHFFIGKKYLVHFLKSLKKKLGHKIKPHPFHKLPLETKMYTSFLILIIFLVAQERITGLCFCFRERLFKVLIHAATLQHMLAFRQREEGAFKLVQDDLHIAEPVLPKHQS